MNLKTEYGYNEDDFVQREANMQELTVTITLCEYRNLIKDIVYQDNTIQKLEEENEKLKEQNKAYQGYIIANHPEFIEKLGDFANALINTPKADHPTEKGGD
jgi:hypothetical protein